MSENNTTPNPEEMGARLDEEIKETVKGWNDSSKKTDYDNLGRDLDDRLRRMIAGWVDADDSASWKEIGEKMDSSTRRSLAKWVGTDENADWSDISSKMEFRTRSGVARLVNVPGHEAEASWSDIGAKVEHDVRGLVGGIVGTPDDAGWDTIAQTMVDKMRDMFGKVAHSGKENADPNADASRPRSGKVEITGEDATTTGPTGDVKLDIDPDSKLD